MGTAWYSIRDHRFRTVDTGSEQAFRNTREDTPVKGTGASPDPISANWSISQWSGAVLVEHSKCDQSDAGI